jgi:hypothetical protein
VDLPLLLRASASGIISIAGSIGAIPIDKINGISAIMKNLVEFTPTTPTSYVIIVILFNGS